MSTNPTTFVSDDDEDSVLDHKGPTAKANSIPDDETSASSSWKPLYTTAFHPSIPTLPIAFQLFHRKKITLTAFAIAQEQEHPLLAISGTNRTLIHPTAKITLHSGPSPDSPALGTAHVKYRSLEIILTAEPERKVTFHELDTSLWQKLKSSGSEYSFEFVADGAAAAPEKFEWRRSKGAEVDVLQGRGGEHGWVLLRLGRGVGGEGEPVASCAIDVLSTTLGGQFAFLNSGATSELGAAWALVAVLSALGLSYNRREAYVTGGVLINSTGD
jgi:hypothetical protein